GVQTCARPIWEPGLLDRDAVDDALTRELRPGEGIGPALGTEAPRRPRRPATPSAARRRERARTEPRIELVEPVVLGRLQRKRIDRPEIAHGVPSSRSRLRRRRSCRTFAV